MTNGTSGCFYKLKDFTFRPDHLVHIDLTEEAGKFGIILWFDSPVHPDRRINNTWGRHGTVVWFDNREELESEINVLSGVRHA